jgi:hypothetical protein
MKVFEEGLLDEDFETAIPLFHSKNAVNDSTGDDGPRPNARKNPNDSTGDNDVQHIDAKKNVTKAIEASRTKSRKRKVEIPSIRDLVSMKRICPDPPPSLTMFVNLGDMYR